MIKTIVLFLLASTLVTFKEEPDIKKIRSLYQLTVLDEEACQKLLNILEPYNEEKPLMLGYKASGTILMAKHVFNPISKLKYFNKGKAMLEKAITADSKNVELIMLRYLTQSNVPAFLGYKDKIQTDKEFILKTVPEIKENELKKYIVFMLAESGSLSQEEIQKLKESSVFKKGSFE